MFLTIVAGIAPAQQDSFDKDALDMTARMDTLAKESTFALNVGDQNGDSWEDFMMCYGGKVRMRFGGPWIFDSTDNPVFQSALLPQYRVNPNADDREDILANRVAYFKGKPATPYYDADATTILMYNGFPSEEDYVGSLDYNLDGYDDILVMAENSFNSYLLLHYGNETFGEGKERLFATDSILLPKNLIVTFLKFSSESKPLIVVAHEKGIYLLGKNNRSLSQDSLILISDTVENAITAKNLLATDITGDGVTDLVIGDGLHLYFFKGGDDFGTYPLSTKTAFYTIKSPRLTDFGHYGFLRPNFGDYMRPVGDITGSGIPYLAVHSSNEAGFTYSYLFFYAGGKALDTLYDAVIGIENWGLEVDTLRSIDNSGRTACLVLDFNDKAYNFGTDLLLLMNRDCEKIPHKTNPAMLSRTDQVADMSLATAIYPAFANQFTKLKIDSDRFGSGLVSIYNILGALVHKRTISFDPGENIEYFDTQNWPSGSYTVEVKTDFSKRSHKLIIHH